MCPPWGANQEVMVPSPVSEIVTGKGNTLLLVPNENDDPPQCVLKDVIDSNTVWEGHLMRKHA
jgi:hypothetical protein